MTAGHTKRNFFCSLRRQTDEPKHYFYKCEIAVSRAELETFHSSHGILDWKLPCAEILCLTSNLNLKNSAGVP